MAWNQCESCGTKFPSVDSAFPECPSCGETDAITIHDSPGQGHAPGEETSAAPNAGPAILREDSHTAPLPRETGGVRRLAAWMGRHRWQLLAIVALVISYAIVSGHSQLQPLGFVLFAALFSLIVSLINWRKASGEPITFTQWETGRAADAHPAIPNRTFRISVMTLFVPYLALTMLLLLGAEGDSGPVVPPAISVTVLWVVLALTCLLEVTGFALYVHRVNHHDASRSKRMLFRLVLVFSLAELGIAINAGYLWRIYGVSPAPAVAWLILGTVVTAGLALVAHALTRGKPYEPPWTAA